MRQWHKNIWSYASVIQATVLLLMLVVCGTSYGQNRYVNEGNKFYEKQNYKEAAANYAKALSRDPNNVPGWFNLGNSLYQQKQFDSSRRIMAAAEKNIKDKNGRAAADYNIGNTYMAERKWEDAINAYKQTLRNNPQDADAKYNLAYAQQMNKKEQQENKDKKQDKQDKKDQDKKQQQQQQQQDKEKKEKEKGEQEQPSTKSKEQAERELDYFAEEEKKLQDKMKKEKGVPVKMQKDW